MKLRTVKLVGNVCASASAGFVFLAGLRISGERLQYKPSGRVPKCMEVWHSQT